MNLRQRLAALRTEAAGISARLADNTATDEDVTRATAVATEIAEVVGLIEAEDRGANEGDEATRTAAAEAARAALANAPADPPASGRTDRPGDRQDRTDPTAGGATRERGELAVARVARTFTEDRAYQDFVGRGLSGSAVVDIAEVRGSDIAMRATIDSTGVGFDGSRNPYVPGIIDQPARPLTVLDQVDRQTTGLNSIPFLQETGTPTTGALEVAEGTAKPEATTALVEVDSPVRTIAAWLNITRQAAEDAPTVAGFIQGRLGFKVLHRLNTQVMNGNGTAPNLRGILNTVGINAYAPGAAEARIISIRKAITMVQVDEYSADTVVLSPADWELVELSTDDNGMFRVSPNVQNAMSPRIWGLSVVVDTVIADGTACVGAFRLGATLWERHGVRVLMTDSHASNFTSNILTVLAEMRAALTVWRPAAFCKITFNGTE